MAESVQLKRTRTSDGATVPWELDDNDPDLPGGGPAASDPVVEYGLRARVGATTDASAPTGDGSLVALLKALRTLTGATNTELSSILSKLADVEFSSQAKMKVWDGTNNLGVTADGALNNIVIDPDDIYTGDLTNGTQQVAPAPGAGNRYLVYLVHALPDSGADETGQITFRETSGRDIFKGEAIQQSRYWVRCAENAALEINLSEQSIVTWTVYVVVESV